MHLYFNFSVMYSTGGMSYFISKVGLGTSCALYTKISNLRNMLDDFFCSRDALQSHMEQSFNRILNCLCLPVIQKSKEEMIQGRQRTGKKSRENVRDIKDEEEGRQR